MTNYRPGITFVSLIACLLALLLMAILGQYTTLILDLPFPLEHTLAAPAIQVIVMYTFGLALLKLVSKTQWLSRAELLCVLFAMLLSAPLMTQGFWHRVVSITATIPRAADFVKMDSFNDKLWPHGKNLLADQLTQSVPVTGRVRWEEVEFEKGRRATLPVLSNDRADEVTTMRLRVERAAGLALGEPYLVSALVRPKNLTPQSYYYCRLLGDTGTQTVETFRETTPSRVTFAHQTGFVRVGAYGAKLPLQIQSHMDVEFGLAGPGQLELTDPKLFSVAALETAFTGKLIVRESDAAQLSDEERGAVIVKPDQMWSWAGVKFVLAGYIPWQDWVQPLVAWGTLFGLILLATLTVNVIMRRQWVDNERYSLPITRVPLALLGETEEDGRVLPPIWRNRMMWIGFSVTLAWCLLRAWNFYNPKVPDLNVYVPLKPYFSDPKWGGMFDYSTFTLTAVYLSLALFMELNVLLSLVVGTFACATMGKIGQATGWNANYDYPFPIQQTIASYLTYGLLVIFFSRKYLGKVFQAAWRGDREASAGEMFSYRTALGLLAATFVGVMVWGRWLHVSPWGMLIYFLYVVMTGFVASKFRAECGAPWGYYTPSNAFLFLTLVGGFTLFGADGMMVCVVASFIIFESVFFLIPGTQIEFTELGRRFGVKPRHLFYTCGLGLLGGIVIGGWVFLSNTYGLGGDTMKYQWAYQSKFWYFNQYNVGLTDASSKLLGQEATGAPQPGISPQTWGYIFGAATTCVLTVLRQTFAGFWFHPFGYLLAFTYMIQNVWGSCLVAWIIRGIVLRIGGAATVKEKLVPFAVGMFLAAVSCYLIFAVQGSYFRAQHVDRFYAPIP